MTSYVTITLNRETSLWQSKMRWLIKWLPTHQKLRLTFFFFNLCTTFNNTKEYTWGIYEIFIINCEFIDFVDTQFSMMLRKPLFQEFYNTKTNTIYVRFTIQKPRSQPQCKSTPSTETGSHKWFHIAWLQMHKIISRDDLWQTSWT
jgi:hypothetical protein